MQDGRTFCAGQYRTVLRAGESDCVGKDFKVLANEFSALHLHKVACAQS